LNCPPSTPSPGFRPWRIRGPLRVGYPVFDLFSRCFPSLVWSVGRRLPFSWRLILFFPFTYVRMFSKLLLCLLFLLPPHFAGLLLSLSSAAPLFTSSRFPFFYLHGQLGRVSHADAWTFPPFPLFTDVPLPFVFPPVSPLYRALRCILALFSSAPGRSQTPFSPFASCEFFFFPFASLCF